jgi:hypothetical protein
MIHLLDVPADYLFALFIVYMPAILHRHALQCRIPRGAIRTPCSYKHIAGSLELSIPFKP